MRHFSLRQKMQVEDNIHDYLSELSHLTEGSFLEELDEYNVEVMYPAGIADQHRIYAGGTLRP